MTNKLSYGPRIIVRFMYALLWRWIETWMKPTRSWVRRFTMLRRLWRRRVLRCTKIYCSRTKRRVKAVVDIVYFVDSLTTTLLTIIIMLARQQTRTVALTFINRNHFGLGSVIMHWLRTALNRVRWEENQQFHAIEQRGSTIPKSAE